MDSQKIWFVGFDAVPKPFTTNYSFIYVMKTFVGRKITIIGRIKGTRNCIKIKDLLIRQRGTGGYVLLDKKYAGKKMRFYMYEAKNAPHQIENLLT